MTNSIQRTVLRHDGSPESVEFAARWKASGETWARREATCVSFLRATYDVDAVHPDDGWVDRVRQTLQLCYPPYRGDVEVGSLIALGGPTLGEAMAGAFRLVRVTSASKPSVLTGDRTFGWEEVEADITVPDPADLLPSYSPE